MDATETRFIDLVSESDSDSDYEPSDSTQMHTASDESEETQLGLSQKEDPRNSTIWDDETQQLFPEKAVPVKRKIAEIDPDDSQASDISLNSENASLLDKCRETPDDFNDPNDPEYVLTESDKSEILPYGEFDPASSDFEGVLTPDNTTVKKVKLTPSRPSKQVVSSGAAAAVVRSVTCGTQTTVTCPPKSEVRWVVTTIFV